MEIFILCWISRSTGLILPVLETQSHSLIMYCSHRSMEIQSQSGGAVTGTGKGYRSSELFWKKCTGNARAPSRRSLCGEVAPDGHKHECVTRWRLQAKKIHQRQAFALPEKVWKSQIVLVEKGYSIIFHPLAPPAVHFGELLDNPVFSLPSLLEQWQSGRKGDLFIWLDRFL